MKQKRINGFFLIIALPFIAMLYINFKFFRGSSSAHIGITGGKEFKISSEKSGIVKALQVVTGQQVKAGDLLVRVENSGLEIEIAKFANRIELLKKEKQEKASLVQSKISYLRAESGIKLEELESEILQISSELKLNEELMNELTGGSNPEGRTNTNPNDIRITSLKQEKHLNNQATKIRITDLIKTHQTELMVLENEIKLLEQERDLLKKQQQQMTKYATMDGVIESVFVRPGEEIEPFTPIMTINPTKPSSVVGFMVGPRSANLSIGSKVKVKSYNFKNIETEGEVIGFGSIVQLPDILQKSTAVKAFGSEVFIRIPESNNFVKGEKVLIR